MSSTEYVPVIALQSTGDSVLVHRILKLKDLFLSKYGYEPSFAVRVPGRVNLIGEHIDYCGFPVFPMAVDKSLIILLGFNEKPVVNLSNVNHDMYPDYSCSLEVDQISIDVPPKWHDYYLCGLKGVLSTANNNLSGTNPTTGADILIDGTIPSSAGLSSSSAMVCGAAVASNIMLNRGMPSLLKTDLARECATFERWIGTQGGGMDQAIQFLAEEGTAKFVEFVPVLSSKSVCLPNGIHFFISHSGVECNKAATNDFNTRVLETRMAAFLLADKFQIKQVNGLTLSKLAMLLKDKGILDDANDLDRMAKITKENLNTEPYFIDNFLKETSEPSMKQVLEKIGIPYERFELVITSNIPLKLRDRALHVYEEANRVMKFKQVCEDSALDNEEKIGKLAQLMNASHVSCRDLYECSCPSLDSLVQSSLSSGALGSRLTGAGWGGCTVSLVRERDSQLYRQKMKDLYPTDDFTFNTMPSDGVTAFFIQ